MPLAINTAVFALVGLVVIGALILVVGAFEDRYRHQHPPISDDEFMARLPPGTSREIALRVRTIIAEQSGIERDRIYPESTFIEMFE